MPFTVITLKSVPPSLKGDLTRWMQEIDTGVYVGNFNTRIRENLWQRVCKQVGRGEATMSFACRNELGYDFCTFNSKREVVHYDGLPLVLYPEKADQQQAELGKGFSEAYKMHKARKKTSSSSSSESNHLSLDSTQKSEGNIVSYVVIDIETTGLYAETDAIIEIGAVKITEGNEEHFQRLVNIGFGLSDSIIRLTGITDSMLQQNGNSLESVLREFLEFIDGLDIIGYNSQFDIKFLNKGLEQCGMKPLTNTIYDLKKIVKKENLFQANYKLDTSLKAFGIEKSVPHRALEDAKLIYELSTKVKKFW